MMIVVEIWRLDDGWKQIGRIHELLCKRKARKQTECVRERLEEQIGRRKW
jgi:hypothetical protein